MLKFYNSLSASTRLLIQSFLAVLGSILSGVAVALYQNYTQAGHLNMQALLNVGLVTFALLFGKAMHDWVPAHAQQLIKSIQDEKAALYDALQRAQTIRSAQNVPAMPAVAPHVVVQPTIAPALKTEDIGAIAAQIAINLMNMAAQRASQAVASTAPAPAAPVAPPAAPVAPAVPPYVDPLRNSAVLPAYSPPVADQATQAVPQVPFTL